MCWGSSRLNRLLRGASTLSYVGSFGLISLVIHEFFHLVVLGALGGDGYITFDLQQGFTHFTAAPHHIWAVELSGGILTSTFFLLAFWSWARLSATPHDTNLEVAAFTSGIGNLVYAPTELLTASQAVGLAAFGAGFAAAAILYFTRLSRWIAPDPTSVPLPGPTGP